MKKWNPHEVYHQIPQRLIFSRTSEYERRRPEETPLYEILQAELNTFDSERAIENRPLPDYVTEELRGISEVRPSPARVSKTEV